MAHQPLVGGGGGGGGAMGGGPRNSPPPSRSVTRPGFPPSAAAPPPPDEEQEFGPYNDGAARRRAQKDLERQGWVFVRHVDRERRLFLLMRRRS